MAQFRRNLRHIAGAVLLSFSCLWPLHAQATPTATDATTFRALALGAIAKDLYYDYQGQKIKVSAGTSSLSTPYKASAGQELIFYRRVPTVAASDSAPRGYSFQPVASAQLGANQTNLVFMYESADAPGQLSTWAVDSSWSSHPPETIRIFNFSQRSAMVKVGDAIAEILPLQSSRYPYASGSQTWVQAAVEEGGSWVLRSSSPQVTIAGTRATLIIIDQEASVERPDTKALLVRNFIEHKPTESRGAAHNSGRFN